MNGTSKPDPAPAIGSAPENAALQAEVLTLRELGQRLAADFDNFRKRTARDAGQKAAAQKIAFIRELLPIVDQLELALAAPAPTSAKELRHGIELTHRQLLQLLARHDVQPENPLGLTFDPHRQEAVAVRADTTQADHIVLEVLQRGYVLGPEIVRPARVVVNDLDTSQTREHGD